MRCNSNFRFLLSPQLFLNGKLAIKASVKNSVETWQQQLSTARRSFSELCQLLDLAIDDFEGIEKLSASFPIIAPAPYLSRIAKGNPNDPLLLQILPRAAELIETAGYSQDPLNEENSSPAPGLIHKYFGRVLLIASSACAIHCRYCFRRHYPYQENRFQRNQHQQALDYITSNREIWEVILSGGDPLILSNSYLRGLVGAISNMPQITTLRIHTRLPVVIPERINAELLSLLSGRLKIVMVVHCNHPDEIDGMVKGALDKLKKSGITLLNQSVLLKNINDDAETLARLSHQLFESGVLPYYLHMPDQTQGTAHFDVPESKAHSIMSSLTSILPGYLVPRLVREQPGCPAKTLLPSPLK
ncbi:MAG: EF-P beta-lysylation protein EpmB [Pseudomonadales bacterium]|nr:EF-P beta-lysylation protein EpmB [Pseudomonadales bacterium]